MTETWQKRVKWVEIEVKEVSACELCEVREIFCRGSAFGFEQVALEFYIK